MQRLKLTHTQNLHAAASTEHLYFIQPQSTHGMHGMHALDSGAAAS